MPKTIGLALGGGGLRGAAHIGILQFLTEQGLQIDCLAGTSAGSIAAALFASGMSPAAIARWARSISPYQVFDFPGLCTILGIGTKITMDRLGLPDIHFKPPMGIIKGDRLERAMLRLTGRASMDELQIPTAIVATDIRTAQMVVFSSPPLLKKLRKRMPDTAFYASIPAGVAVRASTAIPGIFVPRKVHGHVLVDGGVQNNVPADLLALSGADIVIAVDLGYSTLAEEQLDNALEVVMQATDIMQNRITDSILRRHATVVLRPDTGNVNLTSFARIPELIEIGYRTARRNWPRIHHMLQYAG